MSSEVIKNNMFTATTGKRAVAADVPVVVRWAFYAFIATIPFEMIDPGLPAEPTVISLGILLVSLIFHPGLVFQRPPLAFGLFVVYLMIFAAPTVAGPQNVYAMEAWWQLAVVTQLVLMCWVVYNLMRHEKIAKRALLLLGAACMLLAVLQLTGLSQTVNGIGGSSDRVTAFGFHPNNIARILSLGLLAFVGLAYASKHSFIRPRWAVWVAFAVIGVAVVQTGSRGGLLALGAGMVVFAFRSGNFAQKVRNALLVAAALGFFLMMAFQFGSTMDRFEEAVEEGDLARREQIFPAAWQMFLEKPLFGWGAVTAQYELGARLGHVDEDSKNAHNIILNTLMTTGLLGAVPIFAGTYLALYAAWRSRNGALGVLPLSMMVMILVANMSSNWLGNKMHWFVIAYALSSVALTTRKQEI